MPEYPKIISVALTTKCNANCIMCWRRHIPGYSRDMEKGTYDRLLQALEDMPEKTNIFLSTGEPTISPYLGDFLLFCQARNFPVLLYTNAQHVPDKIELFLKQGGHIDFGISIDGGTEEIVQAIQRGCSLKKMLSFISLIRAMPYTGDRPNININFIANADNVISAIDLANALPYHAVDTLCISPMKYFPIVNSANLKSSIEKYLHTDWTDIFERLEEALAEKHIKLKNCAPKGPNYFYPPHCLKRRTMAVISVTGDVYPCPGTESFSLGNIKETSLLLLWNGGTRRKIVEGLNNGFLSDCCKKCSLTSANNGEYYLMR